ncbi:MAG: hypothetical protein A2V57_05885 [Candidatus Aminicenantes bacterium RBG_19FT_COMBO_65_30]|nr:MAG: hypothetical protein A2V57_05885 [Candidatus Aminicenantes bacterium RBG_19FT_COMBO_65_30]
MKEEMLKARIAADDWAAGLTNLNISQKELLDNFGMNTKEGAKWRAEMERQNGELEAQKGNLYSIAGAMIYAKNNMAEQINEIMRTSTTSAEASSRIRELRDSMKAGGQAAEDGAGAMGKLDEATKKYKERLAELLDSLGISAEKNRELIDTDRILHALYESGKISLEKFSAAHKELVGQMFEYGEIVPTATEKTRELVKNMYFLTTLSPSVADQFKVVKMATLDMNYVMSLAPSPVESLNYEYLKLNHTLPETIAWQKKMAELLPRVGQAIMQAVGASRGWTLPKLDWNELADEAKKTTNEIYQPFDNLWSQVAQGFGDTFKNILSGATSLKDALGQIWGNIKDAFFSMCGEIVTKWVKGVLTDIVSNAAKAAGQAASNIASTASSAVKGISGILSEGLAPAIGAFAGTLLAGILKGGPSGHQQEQMINDIKDTRNFAADIKAAIDWVNKSLDLIKWERVNAVLGKLDNIKNAIDGAAKPMIGYLKSINSQMGDIGGAQYGAILREPGLVMTHGTPAEPEWVIPQSKLAALGGGGPRQVSILNTVNMGGLIITDREYMRTRLMPEFLAALNSNEFKNQAQRALGIA